MRIKQILRIIHRVEDSILCLLLGSMVLLAFMQISGRLFLKTGFSWADPIIYHLILWVGLVGAGIATREKEHINIDIVNRFLNPRQKMIVQVITNLFSSVICGILFWAAVTFVRDEHEMGTQILGKVPSWIFQIILPAAFFVIALRFLIIAGDNIRVLAKGEAGR